MCRQPTVSAAHARLTVIEAALIAASEASEGRTPLVEERYVDHTSHQERRCAVCEKVTADILRCAVCKMAYYCSPKCQKRDWKRGHKTKCKELALVGR